MRFNTSLIALISILVLAGCNKVATIIGGPADGHEQKWYETHVAEAKAEVDYCNNKYAGPNATQADISQMPNYCKYAAQAKLDLEAAKFEAKMHADLQASVKYLDDQAHHP